MFPFRPAPSRSTGTAATTLRQVSAPDPPSPSGGGAGAAYADRFAGESAVVTEARERAARLPGPPPVRPAVGAALAVLAAQTGARSVVSIGSGGGIPGLF